MRIPFRYSVMMVALLVSLGVILLIIFWSVYPYRVLEVKNAPVPVSSPIVETGGVIYYTVDFCRYTDEYSTVVVQFEGGIVYVTHPVTVSDTERCGTRNMFVEIPKTLPSGKYHMHVIVSIKVNPIRTTNTEFQSVEFAIINKADSDNNTTTRQNTIDIQRNTDRIEGNTGSINTNTTDIDTSAGDINVNTDDIIENTDRIEKLENK